MNPAPPVMRTFMVPSPLTFGVASLVPLGRGGGYGGEAPGHDRADTANGPGRIPEGSGSDVRLSREVGEHALRGEKILGPDRRFRGRGPGRRSPDIWARPARRTGWTESGRGRADRR